MSTKNVDAIETPKDFPLRKPLQVGDREITEITLREPTSGEIEQMDLDTRKGSEIGALNRLIAKQAKLAPVDIRNIGGRDFIRMQEYLLSFLGSTDKSSES